MKKLLAYGTAFGLAMSVTGAALADGSTVPVWCHAISGPADQGYFIQCNLNLNGSLADSCACPQNYVLIDPTGFPLSNGPGSSEPAIPSRS